MGESQIVSFNRLQPVRRAQFVIATEVLGALILLVTRALAAGLGAGMNIKLTRADKSPHVPGNELTTLVVKLAPGQKSPKHHYAGFVFAHVLSGTIRSQLDRGEVKDFSTGESWVEPPETEHSLFENPSRTAVASLLAVFVARAQLTTYDKPIVGPASC
jgi:quercetin dioxygenase-like cupin family protein